MLKTLGDWLGFRALHNVLAALRSEDLQDARIRGAHLGERLLKLDPKWSGIARQQLHNALDQPGELEVEQLLLENYRHYGKMLAEIACFDVLNKNPEDWFENTGTEYIQHIQDGGLVISAHLGNWELMGMYHTQFQQLVTALVKPVSNRYLDYWINGLRNSYGVTTVTTRDNAINVRRLLQQKHVLVTLADQNSLHHEGVFVPFFGKPACTHYGPAMLAIRAGVPVITALCQRLANGKFKVEYGAPLTYNTNAPLREQTWQLTANLTQRIEQAVRGTPEQWFWVHRRWKYQPRADIPDWKYGPLAEQWRTTKTKD